MAQGKVTVEYGVNSQDVYMAGRTVRELIDFCRNLWVLPETLNVRRNDARCEDLNTVLTENDFVELVKPSGDKGY